MTVLTRLQRDFLSSFFAQPAAQPFVLTGGTALAAFHLQHRLSEDVDLFAVAPLSDAELKHSEILEMALRAADKIEPDDLPKMLKPLDLNELKAYFQALAVTIAQRVKPE